jgi:membrane protein YqaA with SNARE-associated domain
MKRVFEVLQAWGPLGIFGIAFLDGLGIPNPGGTDIALIALVIAEPAKAGLLAALAVLGSLAGTMIFFGLARKGGEALLEQRLQGPRGRKFRRWFHRYGLVTVFIPAVLPLPFLPMKAFVLCAGALGIRPLHFLGVMAAGRVARYGGLAYLAHQLGENSVAWLGEHKWHLALFALLLALGLWALIRFSDRERR